MYFIYKSFLFFMEYKKILKLVLIILIVLLTIFTVIYYAAITRAEDIPLQEENRGIESASLNKVFNLIKDFFEKNNFEDTIIYTSNEEILLNKNENGDVKSSLNRELLNECLEKVENEWTELENHYSRVLDRYSNLDLGLNEGKLFSASTCEEQINPFKDRDKSRIQEEKTKCFNSYSERQ